MCLDCVGREWLGVGLSVVDDVAEEVEGGLLREGVGLGSLPDLLLESG